MADINKQSPGDTPGYVYLMRRGHYFKIGHTYWVDVRLHEAKNMTTPTEAWVYPAEMVWSIKCADKITTERALLQRFAQYHCGVGEWFLLPCDAVEWICGRDEAGLCEGYDLTRYSRHDGRHYGKS